MTMARAMGAAGLLISAVLFLPAAWGADPVKVADPWVRATVPGQPVAGAYMDIVSDQEAVLVSAASPAAGRVELHTMTMEGDMMRMRAVERINLPAGVPVRLAPGGYHVMLMDLKHPLKTGGSVPLTLTIETKNGVRATVQVSAPVREGPGHHPHGR